MDDCAMVWLCSCSCSWYCCVSFSSFAFYCDVPFLCCLRLRACKYGDGTDGGGWILIPELNQGVSLVLVRRHNDVVVLGLCVSSKVSRFFASSYRQYSYHQHSPCHLLNWLKFACVSLSNHVIRAKTACRWEFHFQIIRRARSTTPFTNVMTRIDVDVVVSELTGFILAVAQYSKFCVVRMRLPRTTMTKIWCMRRNKSIPFIDSRDCLFYCIVNMLPLLLFFFFWYFQFYLLMSSWWIG